MADDYPGDISTTVRLPMDGSVQGHIDSATDEDWFHLDLQPGAAYRFTATADDGSEPLIHVYGRTGGVPYVMYTNNHGYVKYNPLSVPYSWVDRDDFYLFVTSDHRVAYRVGVTRLADDHLNDESAAIPLYAGSNIAAQFDYRGDEEYFRIAATLGSTYKIRLTADNGVLPTDTVWQLARKNGWVDFTYANEGGALVATLKADATQDYVIKVDTYSHAPLTAPVRYHVSMTGDIRQLPPDDHNADAPAVPLPAGGSATARLDYAGDTEFFRFDAVARTDYTIRLSADSGVLPPKVSMWTASSTPGGMAPDISIDGTTMVMKFTASNTGGFYVGVKADLDVPLAAPVPFHVTMTASDTEGPWLTDAQGSVDGGLKITFSEPVRAGSGTITLVYQGYTVVGTWDMASKSIKVAGNALTVDFERVMKPGYYSVHLNGDVTTDVSGNVLSIHNRSGQLTLLTTADGGTVAWPSNGTTRGGKGTNDTGVIDGKIEDFKIVRNGHDTVVEGSGKSFTYTGIERLMFTQSDDVLVLTPTPAVSQAWRLYQAAFDRLPDKGGLGYWLYQQEHGMTLQGMATRFLASPEFTNKYGIRSSNADFVANLYHNVLHRDGEAAGLAYHIANLERGVSRADVLAGFSESPENQAAVAELIGHGFAYTPYG